MEYIILALISCYGLSPDQQSYCQAVQKQSSRKVASHTAYLLEFQLWDPFNAKSKKD